jgi:hypothetical protein
MSCAALASTCRSCVAPGAAADAVRRPRATPALSCESARATLVMGVAAAPRKGLAAAAGSQGTPPLGRGSGRYAPHRAPRL